MDRRQKKFSMLLLAGLCSVIFLTGCASGEKDSSADQTDQSTDDARTDGDDANETSGSPEDVNSGGTGEFSMEDIEGETYTQEMFADYDLTMVNVFTTWCTPCINEIPDLEELRKEMADQGMNVVGIVLDAIDYSGGIDESTVEKAKILAEQTGVTYPFLIPDETYLNGRLSGIEAVPETFFVDQEGNFVGEVYSGSRSLEGWKEIAEEMLKGVGQ